MSKQYIMVRIRKEDYDRIVSTKKIPMEQDIFKITGKEINIKNTQLFKIAANATWDLGENFQQKIIGSVRIKKGCIRL